MDVYEFWMKLLSGVHLRRVAIKAFSTGGWSDLQFRYNLLIRCLSGASNIAARPTNLEPVGVYLFHAEKSAQRSTFWPDTKWARVIDSNLKNATLREVLIISFQVMICSQNGIWGCFSWYRRQTEYGCGIDQGTHEELLEEKHYILRVLTSRIEPGPILLGFRVLSLLPKCARFLPESPRTACESYHGATLHSLALLCPDISLFKIYKGVVTLSVPFLREVCLPIPIQKSPL